jgi:membrane protein
MEAPAERAHAHYISYTDYGAAGSLVTLLLWVYYSSLMFFFGAVLTQVYAARCGSKASAAENAPNPRPARESQKTRSLPCSANSV